MAVNLSPIGGVAGQFFDNNGDPLSGGKIYTYSAGTTTPQATYTSAGGGTPHANPIILDAAGRVPGGEIWLTDGLQYKFVIQTSTNVLIGTYDNIIGINSNFVNYTNSQEIQTATAGQTVFTLTTMQYQPGTNSLSVFVDGVNQYGPGSMYAYQETNSNTVTFSSGLHVGAEVKFTTSSITSSAAGDAEQISYTAPYSNSVATNVELKLAQTISVKDFGAVGDGVQNDTTAVQNAINAAPVGSTVYFPAGTYLVTDAITINKSLVIRGAGPGSFVADTGGSYLKQNNVAKNGFTLVPTVGGYAFGQWGIVDVHFFDMAILGPSTGSRAVYGIGVDTTVNGGNYHVRECTFNNLNIRYFATAVNLTGICYLNDFNGGCFSYCNNGFELLKGLAPDTGGQTRFFGVTFSLLANDCIRWNLDTASGDIALFGCTLADAQRGLVVNEEATVTAHGCSFESLVNGGNGAGVYTEIKEANPNSQGPKNIIGCKFSANDASIWVDKTTLTFTSGDFAWPMLIDANAFLDTSALKITVPVGDKPLNSQQFVLGSANAGLTNGELSTSQISTNYMGRDLRKQTLTRRFTFGPTTAVDTVLVNKMVVTSARVYLTANSSIFTGLSIGDAANNSRYFLLNAQTQTLNTWVNWTAPVPEFTIDSSLKLNLVIFGTVGLQGATGVFEITGYVP